MTANMEVFYWQENDAWFEYDKATKEVKLTAEAPERAKNSFLLWKEAGKRGAL